MASKPSTMNSKSRNQAATLEFKKSTNKSSNGISGTSSQNRAAVKVKLDLSKLERSKRDNCNTFRDTRNLINMQPMSTKNERRMLPIRPLDKCPSNEIINLNLPQ